MNQSVWLLGKPSRHVLGESSDVWPELKSPAAMRDPLARKNRPHDMSLARNQATVCILGEDAGHILKHLAVRQSQ